ncbi:cell division control protein 45 [Physcia stellaris]|nr:cell division control protein 45 [Physcia stellaris]
MTSEGVKTVFGGNFERSPWYDVFANFGEKNMFSFTSSQAHKQRRRIIAAAYSKPAVSHYRVQAIVEIRVAKLLNSVNNLSGNGEVLASSTRPLVVRNLFRALQADIFTAFAFSEQEGTTFLDDLKVGPNTMEDLGMGMMDLCHDEKRDMYFFWESEKPFKYIAQLLDRNGPIAHRKAQDWLAGLARKFEERVQLTIGPDHPRQNAGVSTKASTAGFGGGKTTLDVTCRSKRGEDSDFPTIDKLVYLNAVVMESLRLVDTVSSYQTRVTIVSAQPYLLNRQADIYFNPESFEPDRWMLPPDEYRALARQLFTYSTGPRACIGRELSLAIMKTVIARIYVTELVNEDRVEKRAWEGANRMSEVRFEKVSWPQRRQAFPQ